MKNTNEKILVVFGAPDHEEKLAREIAEKAGCQTATACANGFPVSTGTAYKATSYRWDSGPAVKPEFVILFECGEGALDYRPSLTNHVIKCDHHNPGDPGYDKGPEEFWLGSSLGQLCAALQLNKAKATMVLREGSKRNLQMAKTDLLFTAAGDHCPADAYAGRCQGIDPEEFFAFRVKQQAEFLWSKMNYDEMCEAVSVTHLSKKIKEEVEAAKDLLDFGEKVNGIVDLRDMGLIPNLPEAALRAGHAYMAKIDETDRERKPTGNKKIVMGGHTTPDQVKAFMAWASNLVNRIGEPYGNPTRGFAGVVVTERSCPACKGAWTCETLGTCPECGVPYPPESQIG
jgi:hypothetical protein